MIPVEVVLDRAGRTPYRLTPNVSSLQWSTAAVGGFSSCTFTLPGPPPFWKRELPHLSMLRIVLDTFVIWEGRIEDITMSLKDETTSVQAFGLQRLLDLTSVRRIWSQRNAPFFTSVGGIGYVMPNTNGRFLGDFTVDIGGMIQIAGNGASVANGGGAYAEWDPGTGFAIPLTAQRFMADFALSGANTGAGKLEGEILYSTNGGGSWTITAFTASTAISLATPDANVIRFGMNQYQVAALTAQASDTAQYTNCRILGTSLTEDASGGFYGGTILNDLIALVPGLTIGTIESGSDFTIQSLERSVRDTARSVVNEVASYHAGREYRVWEGGRFDWKSVNAGEPQWIATLDDLDSGSEITATVDGLANTLYVLYLDAASQFQDESFASSTDQRNPFVKQGQRSDVLANPGFPMTSSSASQLATALVTDQGGYPQVQGKLVIPATKVIRRATGSPLPAFMIRGGDNIVVSDLPKTDLFQQGRDGETLFHIVATECSLADGSMTLEIEGQTRRTDVLLARLASATRLLTG